jgi:hypothetical protein
MPAFGACAVLCYNVKNEGTAPALRASVHQTREHVLDHMLSAMSTAIAQHVAPSPRLIKARLTMQDAAMAGLYAEGNTLMGYVGKAADNELFKQLLGVNLFALGEHGPHAIMCNLSEAATKPGNQVRFVVTLRKACGLDEVSYALGRSGDVWWAMDPFSQTKLHRVRVSMITELGSLETKLPGLTMGGRIFVDQDTAKHALAILRHIKAGERKTQQLDANKARRAARKAAKRATKDAEAEERANRARRHATGEEEGSDKESAGSEESGSDEDDDEPVVTNLFQLLRGESSLVSKPTWHTLLYNSVYDRILQTPLSLPIDPTRLAYSDLLRSSTGSELWNN